MSSEEDSVVSVSDAYLSHADLEAVDQRLQGEVRRRGLTDQELRQSELLRCARDIMQQIIGPDAGDRCTRATLNALMPRREKGPPRARLYTPEQVRALLLMLYLVEPPNNLTLESARRRVESYLTRITSRSNSLLETIVESAIRRFETTVVGRLLMALILQTFQVGVVPAGSIVVAGRLAGGDSRLLRERSIQDWIDQLAEDSVARIGLVGESGEIALIEPTQVSPVASRYAFRVTSIDTHGHQFLVALGILGSKDEVVGSCEFEPFRDAIMPPNEGTPTTVGVAVRLIRVICEGFTSLIERVRAEATAASATSDTWLFTQHSDVIIWLMTQFACYLAQPDEPTAARCLVLQPEANTQDNIFRLVDDFASDRLPWSGLPSVRTINSSRLLSGFGRAMTMSLSVPTTEPPFDEMMTRHSQESTDPDDGMGTPYSGVSIPIPTADGRRYAQLYVWAKRISDADFPSVVRCLEFLAPLVGEIVERRRSVASSVRSLQHLTARRCLDAATFEKTVQATLGDLLVSGVQAGASRTGAAGGRIAMIVLRPATHLPGAHPGTVPDFADTAWEWLSGELQRLEPVHFLRSWLGERLGGALDGGVVFGRLSSQAVAIMIPRQLPKEQIDDVRLRLISEVNGLACAEDQKGQHVFRLYAWCVDVRLSDFSPADAAVAAGRLLDRARSSERVMPYLVESYAQAVTGHWQQAFDYANEGLENDDQNGYLHRRAAYFLMRQGHFNVAARHARLAVTIADDIVADRCLLGDAILGQGQLIHALQEYAEAAGHNPEHPLPAYHLGYALILVGTLLEREIFDRLVIRDNVQTSDIEPNLDAGIKRFEYELKLIRERRQVLGKAATTAFGRAWARFAQPEYASSRRVNYLDQRVSTRIGLYRSAWMESDEPSVPTVSSAVSAFHFSDSLHRELILANMWERRMGQVLWDAVLNDLTWSGVLHQLGLLPPAATGP
ncbi:MAG: hypothetical protein U0893_00655 [Chloroflexota bacterium]